MIDEVKETRFLFVYLSIHICMEDFLVNLNLKKIFN